MPWPLLLHFLSGMRKEGFAFGLRRQHLEHLLSLGRAHVPMRAKLQSEGREGNASRPILSDSCVLRLANA